MKQSTLKPGLLVSLKTTVRGGVTYTRREIEPDHTTPEGARIAQWETRRDIPDAVDFEMATKARSKARSAVTAVCCASSFGLLCPVAEESKLDAAVAEARRIAGEHNKSATKTRVEVFVLVGRVADSDVEAARAIGAEIRELLEAMQAGIKAADPEAIREAANKARGLGSMLSADVAGQVSAAIVEARSAAREIVKRVQNGAEEAAQVVQDLSVRKIEAARFSFLDLDEGERVEVAPAGRAVELYQADETIAGPAAEMRAPGPLFEVGA